MKRMKPFLPQKELNNFILEVNDNIYLQSLLLDADEEIFTEINNFSQNENQMLKFLDSFLTVYRYGPRNYEFYFDVLLKSVEALKRYFSSDFLVHFFHEQIKIVLFLYEHECITIRSIAIKYLDNNLMNQFFKNKLSVQDVMNCISSKCALTADDLNSRIIQLIEKDDVIEFQKLVSETNFDLNSRFTILDISKHFSNYKPSILDYAVFCSSINLVKFLLLQNVEMTFKLPIFAACCSNYEIIHILEDHKIPFDIESLNTSIQFHKNDIYKYLKNKYDIKPTKDSLLVSVLSHNYEVFIELFNLYLPDDVYYNAFHIASQYSNYSVIKLLCKYCNIFRTYYQMTPLSLAVSNGAIHIVELMLQNGKPLSFESELFLFNITHKIAFQSYYEDLIKLLIDVENCNIMKKDSQDWTLLHHAAELNLYNIVELLLQKPNIEINAVTYQGSTPLIIACSRNNFEIVKLLIDNKADINIKPKNGWSCLHYACNHNNFEMAKLLFENGIKDPNLPNALMKSPLNIAIQKGNVEIVKLFFENIKNIDIWNSNINPLKQAVVGKHIDITKCILEHCQCTIDDIDKMLKLSESDAITILLRLYKNRIEKL